MPDDLDPHAVAARLEELRKLWQPEDASAVRRRMQPACATTPARPFDQQVALRLKELRALLELTAYLHQRRPDG